MDSNGFNRMLKKIEKKLEKSPKLRKEIGVIINRLEEIFESNIEVFVVQNDELDEYEDHFEEYEISELDFKSMSLKNFINFLKKEDETLDVAIDPIYLKEGINDIDNVLITTINNKVIIVPMKSGINDEKEKNSN